MSNIRGENSAVVEDQCVTHPPERTGATTRTKGGSKGKLSCTFIKQNNLVKHFPSIQDKMNQSVIIMIIKKQLLLYRRNWAECSPRLPSLLRPASRYVMDCLGLPCNETQQTLNTNPQLNTCTHMTQSCGLVWELTSLTWRAIRKGCRRLVRLNKYLRAQRERRGWGGGVTFSQLLLEKKKKNTTRMEFTALYSPVL